MLDRLLMGNNNNSDKIDAKKNSQEKQAEPAGKWLNLLPCDHYEYEYNSCAGWRGKVNNYYRGVSISDEECKKYQELFIECHKYQKDPSSNFDSLLKLNKYENELMKKRLDSARGNDVWTMRKSPPDDWNAKLPEWCQERLKESIWYKPLKKEE